MSTRKLGGHDAGPVSSRPSRLLGRLVWLYGVFTVVVFAGLLLDLPFFAFLGGVHVQAVDAARGGSGGLTLAALLMASTVLCAALLVASARVPHGAGESGGTERAWFRRWLGGIDAGTAARQGQAAAVGLGMVLTCIASWWLWPEAALPASGVTPNLLGAFAIALAFPSLVAERVMAASASPQLPEALALRRVLLATTVLLAAAGASEIARGVGLQWIYWIIVVLSVVPWIVMIELGLRAGARLFLPPPQATEARSIADSFFLTLVTGGPRAPSALIRDHLGLDFTRSWALSFLTSAALPAVFATALLCWGLSGLKLIDQDQRGVYERFGAPVAVLGPGIHLLLPWPLGVMWPVEFGRIHEIAVGTDQKVEGSATIAAEAIPPPSLNHLWETAEPKEVQYLVASQGDTGSQEFQVVSAEIHVLYRVGLRDEDALQSVYNVTAPASLVKAAADRIVSRYFASHTLDEVMGARRERLAETLRAALAQDIQARKAGVEIVAVLIEAIHPPAGAAAAYHEVQAAEIKASTSIANEQGRAERVAGVAQEEAHELVDNAQATSEEKIEQADGEAYKFAADRKAYAEGPSSFLRERAYTDLTAALKPAHLTIIDSGLKATQGPIIDYRNGTAAPNAASGASPSSQNISAIQSALAADADANDTLEGSVGEAMEYGTPPGTNAGSSAPNDNASGSVTGGTNNGAGAPSLLPGVTIPNAP